MADLEPCLRALLKEPGQPELLGGTPRSRGWSQELLRMSSIALAYSRRVIFCMAGKAAS